MRRSLVIFTSLTLAFVFIAGTWLRAQESSRRKSRVARKAAKADTTATIEDRGALDLDDPMGGAPTVSHIGGQFNGPPVYVSDDESSEETPKEVAKNQAKARSGSSRRMGPTPVEAPPQLLPPEPASEKSGGKMKSSGTKPPVSEGSSSRRSRPRVSESPSPAVADPNAKSAEPARIEPETIKTESALKGPTSAHTTSVPVTTSGEAFSATSQMPQLAVETNGPAAITVGKTATYVIQLNNSGAAVAREIEVHVGLPRHASILSHDGSKGDASTKHDSSGRQLVTWRLREAAAHSREQLTLKLVVEESDPFDLTVDFLVRPDSVRKEVTVKEPQLDIRLEGPSDMRYGDQKSFQLSLSNPGSGDAENVVVEVASGGGQSAQLKVGTITAGQSKQIPFQVVAKAAGEMEIRATAKGDSKLAAEAASRVIVRRANLAIEIDGPPMRFAGSEADYQIRVANQGDAPAESVVMNLSLPVGAKYLGGVDGTQSGNAVQWKIGNLAPGNEKTYTVKCVLNAMGENQMGARAVAADELTAVEGFVTNVDAVSDLKMAVNDPPGPIAVGTEVVYDVKITNRGSRAADDVKIVVQFADGVEPIEATGGAFEITEGQVVYDPFPAIAAGAELNLKVKAKVLQEGNHAYRVEVVSGEQESRLVTEGMSRCFAEAGSSRMAKKQGGSKKLR